MLDKDFPERVAQRAESLFRKDKLNCAETVFKALLEESGQTCPLETLRLASAFGKGMGKAGCSCGSLVGGEMAVGFFFGREEETGFCPESCEEIARELHDRFVKENRVTCCRILHKGLAYGTPEQFDSCALRSVRAARMAAEVILAHMPETRQ